jgi:hypothetical protein
MANANLLGLGMTSRMPVVSPSKPIPR